MPTESKTLTEQRIRKERALATMRELQLHQLEGSLPSGRSSGAGIVCASQQIDSMG